MAQSQTPPNTMIVVNSLPLKKKTKNTFFFSRHLKYWLHFLHYFSSHVCAVVFITIFVASTPPMKAEAECLPSILVNEPKEEWRGDGFEAVRVCVHVHGKTDVCLSLSAHCRVFDSFLVFTFNPLGTICHSLLHSVHYLHLSPLLPSLCLSRCSAPPLFSLLSGSIFCFFSFFFQIRFLFSALSPLSVLDSHSSSVSSHLPENFTIALNDAWVSFDSLSSLHRNTDSSAFPEMIVQEYCVCLCASICIGNGVRNHNRWF